MSINAKISEFIAHVGPRLMIAGGSGLVGQALQRLLHASPIQLLVPSKAQLDCTRQADVEAYMQQQQPDSLIIAAGRVGGIWANQQFPAEFAFDNLMINANLLNAARLSGVKRVLVLGSSCIYPKFAAQPIAEVALLSGALEPTNEAYAVAKIAALKLAHSYVTQYGMDIRALMPTNLYGPGDRFDPNYSHVIPALLLRMRDTIAREAAEFVVWGTGTAQREFLYVDDLARAVVHVLCLAKAQYQASWQKPAQPSLAEFFYNVGSADEVTIASLVETIAQVTGFTGKVVFDADKPDGTPRKRLDCQRLHQLCDWRPQVSLAQGLALTWQALLHQGNK